MMSSFLELVSYSLILFAERRLSVYLCFVWILIHFGVLVLSVLLVCGRLGDKRGVRSIGVPPNVGQMSTQCAHHVEDSWLCVCDIVFWILNTSIWCPADNYG